MEHMQNRKALQPQMHLSPPATPFQADRRSQVLRSPTKHVRLSDYSKPTLDTIIGDEDLTASQKDLALRVSRAAESLREWYHELQCWQWTGSFQKHGTILSSTILTTLTPGEYTTLQDEAEIIEHYVSLTPRLISEYEARLDGIHDQLEDLALDDLKQYILDLHTSTSRPASRESLFTSSGLTFLDDFSFYVTQTLVRSLPTLSCLTPELRTWSTRISVLRQIPRFVHRYNGAAAQMKIAWSFLDGMSMHTSGAEIERRRTQTEAMKTRCHAQIAITANVLDTMLDMLEGHVDIFPDSWIDAFENIEADLGEWCTAAHALLHSHTEVMSTRKTSIAVSEDANLVIGDMIGATDHAVTDHDSCSAPPMLHFDGIDVLGKEPDPVWDSSLSLGGPEDDALVPKLSRQLEQLVTEQPSSMVVTDAPDFLQPGNANVAGDSAHNLEKELQASSADISTSQNHLEIVNVGGITTSDDSAAYKRLSDNSEHSTKFSDQSLLGNSVFSESALADVTDATNFCDTSEVTQEASPAQRPYTPDESGFLDDDTIFENLLSSVISEFDDDAMGSDMEESPLKRKQPISKAPKPPLNALMKKRTYDSAGRSIAASAFPTQSDIASLNTDQVSKSMPLELQISNILDAIPTPIRLQTVHKSNSHEVRRTRMRTPSGEQDRRSIAGSRSGTPSLTLAPAEEMPRKRGSGGSDIRVYHLIQAGQDKPIKLFIRRVGENGERVMVRVGGGWADLGEYLRIYAEHHGRRTTSEGRIEMQALRIPKTGTTPKKSDSRRSSLLGPSSRSTTPALGRSMTPTLSERSNRTTLLPSASGDTPEVGIVTPQSTTNDDQYTTTGWDEVGMSGPRTRRGETTSEKKEWIDGIVEQAKRDFGQHVQVGDLGKSGSTRRIFFKGRKPSGNT